MSHIEAMKQMVEALEDINSLLTNMTGATFSKLEAALKTGRQAIAEAEKQEALRQKTEDHDVDCLCSDCFELDNLDDEVLGFNGWGFPIEKPSKKAIPWVDKAFERLCEQWNNMTSEEFAIVQRFLCDVYAHAPQRKPHPDCDRGCMYVCTEGFSKQPKCENKENNDE